ncbi:enoyl-CoA hydratase/carnithine racemase [Candidatus Scalindua japonica]|uniref:Enoyl-CoA hydratase/carnithine racemase n=1 Tax=Candidatus Scalindua japonica TaxID=1284222 RepID=A0A286TTC8_9BACT|nr:enoyl-CoA hydratase/isomerase [Candidatus Scalindua japonica]GAX59169.1 enoyl-CoA hydratase/carnithine racemase [Candidatus Scalindua japonica]
MSGYHFKTLGIEETAGCVTVTIDRSEHNNSINILLLNEINLLFDNVELNPDVRLVILKGNNQVFCTGMDFDEVVKIDHNNRDEVEKYASSYFSLLERFTRTCKIIVSIIDGKATAGGIGFVAASDYAIATERASFSLSETLFGLLPACVIPFLIRRTGFQKAYLMTLTTQNINAEKAYSSGLIDELTNTPDESVRLFLLRVNRIKAETVVDLKEYFKRMWIINEQVKKDAVNQITELLCKHDNMEKIKAFVEKGQFPWE